MTIKIHKTTLLLIVTLGLMISMAIVTITTRVTDIAQSNNRNQILIGQSLGSPSVAGVTTENKTFTRTNDYLTNPGIGWQYMPSSNTSFFPETTSYISRSTISWKVVNPNDGQFDWSIIDNEIAAVEAAGKQTSFRIYTMRGESFGGDQLPNYVKNQANTMNRRSPNYNSCTYQEEWGEFVAELSRKYDGNENIAFIDISGYSDFNEWSYQNFTTFEAEGLDSPSTIDGFSRKRLVDIFLGGSSNSHRCEDQNGNLVTVSYNYPTKFEETQLIMPYAGERMSLNYATNKSDNVGIRQDCLGSNISGWDVENNEFGRADVTNLFGNRWRTAPVVYEVCPGGWDETRATDLLKYSHASLVHDNPNGSQPYENIDVVTRMMSPVGYRFALSEAVVPTTTDVKSFDLTMSWENFGYAPAYERMGQDFDLRVLLYDSADNLVETYENFGSDPNTWFPAEDLEVNSSQSHDMSDQINLPADITNGEYILRTGIYDLRQGRFINVYNDMNSEGLVELGSFTLSDSGVEGSTSTGGSGTDNGGVVEAPPVGCAADFDKNGIVDINDFAEFAAVYKSQTACKLE